MGVGIDEGGSSLFIDKNGLATLSGGNAYVVLGDHQPEQAVAGKPLTYSDFKIWHLTDGGTFDFKNRPTCGYYKRSVTNGVAQSNLYNGTPETGCGTQEADRPSRRPSLTTPGPRPTTSPAAPSPSPSRVR